VGCELEEKERFWSELDEVMESIPTGERVVIGADFNGHVGEGNTGDEEVMGKFGVKERNLEGQMVVGFAKRMDMAVVNTYFQKREEHRVTYKSGGRRTQKLRQALGGQVVLPDDWETTAEVIRETGRKVLGVSSGRRKEDKETWWWNEEVQNSVQRKRLAKKKWDMDRTEENRQEYKELQRRVKREVSKAKQKAYDELYTRLDTREGEKDLYRLARQRDRDGKYVQQVRVIKDRDGRVLTSEESVQRRWKEYFEELMNEGNERDKRVEGVNSVEQKVDKIRKDEVRKALKRMKSGKAVGPDDIPVEVWKCLGEAAVEFLASLFNRVLESERMPEEWRRSVLVPIFKNKGDVQSCSNYRGIKLMRRTIKLWERVVEATLRKVVEICEQQYGFMPRKSTTDVCSTIFALRILMEKYRDGQRELHCVFVDLEKAYDRVPREELWYCMRKSGVAEKYVRVVQDMYERSRTVVRCAVGQTEEFNVEVGLHQGSALSPFLFAIVMDQLSEEVRQESPWTMMFADDIVVCSESREQVEENLERWRFALERRGMKVSRSKTEYMCVNERKGSGTVRLQGEEVKKVQEFKYSGSTVRSNGEYGKEVKKRVQAGWNGWRKVSGVLCDRKISARIKGKVYRTVVRAAMLYGLETVSLRKRQESELEVAELKMLRNNPDLLRHGLKIDLIFSRRLVLQNQGKSELVHGFALGLGDGHVYSWTDGLRRRDWHDNESIRRDEMRVGAAPDAPNPSPSQKVRSSDGSWGGARNVERPVGGARSRARHLGGGSEKQKQGEWGEARTKARQVRGTRIKARQVGGTRIKARQVGGVRSRSETSGGSKGPDGKAKGSDATSTAEQRRRTRSTAEPQSRMTSTAEPQSRMTSTAEQQDQATSTAEQQLRATSTAEHSHRATSTDERRLRGDDVRLAEVWNSPRGGRAGAGCCRNSPPLATGKGEQGKPYPLAEDECDDSVYKENGFNIYVSNNIALDRSLPDIRHPNCKQKLYLENLPNTSIIIPFHNEGWSSLLRTVHSIVNRTPDHLIAEIVLVDDYSDRGVGPLVPVTGTLNASAYQDILDNFMLPALWEQFGDDPFLFQHDCTPVHKASSPVASEVKPQRGSVLASPVVCYFSVRDKGGFTGFVAGAGAKGGLEASTQESGRASVVQSQPKFIRRTV
ncbi:hypothetical protein QTP70_024441, partial [Hemibagrus guttatus]